MSFAHPLTFLRRAIAVPALLSSMLALSVPFAWGASSPVKITIHIPGKSLTVLVFYFCKDEGLFFAALAFNPDRSLLPLNLLFVEFRELRDSQASFEQSVDTEFFL